MGGGNGAKSAQARARKEANAPKGPTSQLKTNAAAQSIQCDICKQTFQSTAKQPILQAHVDSKHAKSTFALCFPKVAVAA